MRVTNNQGNYDFEIKDVDIKKVKKVALIVVAVIAAIILISKSFYSVKEQEAAVLLTFGNAKTVSEPGLHFKIPFILCVVLIALIIPSSKICFIDSTFLSGSILPPNIPSLE